MKRRGQQEREGEREEREGEVGERIDGEGVARVGMWDRRHVGSSGWGLVCQRARVREVRVCQGARDKPAQFG